MNDASSPQYARAGDLDAAGTLAARAPQLRAFDLTGRVALVTGASRGIGRAIAVGLAQAGAQVVLVSRDQAALDAVAGEITAATADHERALAVAADVSRLDENQRMVDAAVRRFGGLDVFVPVAGVNRRKRLLEMEPEDYDFITGTNLRGLYFGCQAAVKAMLPRGERPNGKLITIGSLTSLQGVAPGLSVYAATKGAVAQLTKQLAVELAPERIQANCIAPGFILTDLTRAFWGTEPRRSWVLGRVPTGRFGEPDDLVGAAIFLASAASDYVTGQVLAVDGGFLAGSDWAAPR
jgi:NAD(P)-dependent dehydrogenase (short-subunit alcohol dehydrogenase family)